MTGEAVEGGVGFLKELFGEAGEPGGEIVGPELAIVFFAQGTLTEKEDGEMVGGEGKVRLGEDEEALVEHELNAASDFVGFVFDPGGGVGRDNGVEDEETIEFGGGVLVVLFRSKGG